MSDRTQSVSPPVPPLSLLLGYGPGAVLLLLGGTAWLLPFPWSLWGELVGQLFAGAILLFLAGVRRGASFYTDGGARPIQIATMLWLFGLGLATLVLPPALAFLPAAVGYGSVALLDPPAARRGEVPAHFARLRPPQMALFLVACLLLAARATAGLRVTG